MTVRKIMLFPENKEILRAKAIHVHAMNQEVKRLIADLKDTLLACHDGMGLSAPQINKLLRIMVVRLETQSGLDNKAGSMVVFVNPEIIESGDEQKDFDGCLSIPGLYGETTRPHFLHITGLDEDGKPAEQVFLGYSAAAVHHQIDHLNGVLFIDRVTTMKDLCQIQVDDSRR